MNSEIEVRICESTGKRCYNGREAGHIINQLKKHHLGAGVGKNRDFPRRKYYCKKCGCYHLTKIPKFTKDSLNCAWEDRFYQEYDQRNLKNKKKISA